MTMVIYNMDDVVDFLALNCIYIGRKIWKFPMSRILSKEKGPRSVYIYFWKNFLFSLIFLSPRLNISVFAKECLFPYRQCSVSIPRWCLFSDNNSSFQRTHINRCENERPETALMAENIWLLSHSKLSNKEYAFYHSRNMFA